MEAMTEMAASIYPSPSEVATAFLSLLMARRVQSSPETGSHTSRDSSNLDTSSDNLTSFQV